MGKSQRDKGSRVEREIVKKLNDLPTVEAERVPLSGAAGGSYAGDISMRIQDKGFTAEVKARKNGAGFVTLERWLGKNDLLILKRDRQEPMVVLPWETLRAILDGNKV